MRTRLPFIPVATERSLNVIKTCTSAFCHIMYSCYYHYYRLWHSVHSLRYVPVEILGCVMEAVVFICLCGCLTLRKTAVSCFVATILKAFHFGTLMKPCTVTFSTRGGQLPFVFFFFNLIVYTCAFRTVKHQNALWNDRTLASCCCCCFVWQALALCAPMW